MKNAAIGATGTVGSRVVSETASQGHDLILTTASPDLLRSMGKTFAEAVMSTPTGRSSPGGLHVGASQSGP
ncbi:hypothetical protein [Streptomyces sp. NPDC005407]|uniref:hypothetical protein n=1 Tax=Streptomyces sp. NPDC005407 TaxID=3155340 RepID=UPI0033BCF17B